MSHTIAEGLDLPDADGMGENLSPNRTKAGLRSVMKTASKPQRVLAEIDEGSPMPVRVLRNGKKVRATPHLPKASRVELAPSESGDTTALSHALRVPLKQEATPELKQGSAENPGGARLSFQELQTPEDKKEPGSILVNDELMSPAALISSLHEPSSSKAGRRATLVDNSPGAHVEGASEPASQVQDGLQSAAVADMPVRDAAACMYTPKACDGSATKPEEASVGTPTQAAAAATDEDPDLAAHSVPTPLPGPSPELTMRSDFITPPTQILGGNEASEPEEAPSSRQQKTNPDEPLETSLQHQVSLEEQRTTDMSSYIARGKVTPYMERKLRALQAEEWSDQDAGRVHKGRLERERAAALAARRASLSSADQAATRRVVQGIFGRVAATQGKGLGESMVRHKSRLEREKEAADAEKKASPEEAGSHGRRPKAAAQSSLPGEGLGDMKAHMSRLEKDRAAVAARKAAGVSSPAVDSRLPSYMRQTAASAAMQREGRLGENMKVHKSQLEKDREKALALQAARKTAGHNPLTPFPARIVNAAKPRLSFGSLGGAPLHKSKLERAKEAAAAAAAGAPASRPAKPVSSTRTAAAPGEGLGDIKPHRSRLEKEQANWQRHAEEQASGKAEPARRRMPQELTHREGFSDFVPN